ncbi:MAG: hypothetical protein GKS06_19785 [Acidobacteria bacterium]|nr:hypothetical protein [Acidobacteriota bacterium]
MNPRIRWALQFAVSAVLLVVLLRVFPLDLVREALAGISWSLWFGALAMFLTVHAISALKWRLLVGPDVVSVGEAIRIHYAGLSTSLVLPGLMSGDVVRGGMLGKRSGDWHGVVVAGLFDRVIDVTTLLVLAGFGLLTSVTVAGDALRLFALAALTVAAVVTAMVVGLSWLGGGQREWQMNLADAIARLKARPVNAAAAFSISIVVQLGFLFASKAIGEGVGLEAPLAVWLVAWPLSKLAAVLPVGLAGIGMREVALVALFGFYGISEPVAIAAGLAWESVLVVGLLSSGLLAAAASGSLPE